MVHHVRELGRTAVVAVGADDGARLEGDLAVIDDAGMEIGDVDPDVTLAARHVHPALALHGDDDLRQTRRRFDIDRRHGARPCDPVGDEPVVVLKGRDGLNHTVVVARGVGTAEIAHSDKAVAKLNDGVARLSRLESVRLYLRSPAATAEDLFEAHLFLHETRVLRILRRQVLDETAG